MIALQMVAEVLVIAFFAFVLALLLGNLVAGRLADGMMAHILQSLLDGQAKSDHIRSLSAFFRLGLDQDQLSFNILTNYGSSLQPSTMLLFLGIGLGTTLLAAILPIIYILLMNPKRILM